MIILKLYRFKWTNFRPKINNNANTETMLL